MGLNDLKKHTVKVGSGSGCIFQPMDEESTYILTAKHLFQNKNQQTEELEFIGDGTEVAISFLAYDDNIWNVTTETFTVQYEENFFPHPEADAAILKIPYRQGYDNIHVRKNRVQSDYHLCGFPGNLKHQPTVSSQYDSEKIKTFLELDDYFEVAQLENSNLNYSEIVGYSGGGIMTFDESNNVFVIGIQSRMAKEKLNLNFGKIGFVPVKYFEEIIETYKANGKLVELLPVFLKSFVSLIGDSFQMGSAPIYKEEGALSELLTAKAQLIRKSDLTPLGLKSFMGDKRLLIKYNDNVELRRKKVWTFWLELLVILNIAKDKIHKTEDLNILTQNIRFFYSNTDKDFLDEHLQDLWKVDYSDLADGGLVIFASNQKRQSEVTKGVLDLCDIVPNISSARREFTKIQNETNVSVGIDIADTLDFPFDRFKYANIATFKEDAAMELDKNFVDMNPADCYPLLKELYERLLP